MLQPVRTESESILNEYYNKYKKWDEERIKSIYNKLQNDGIITIQIVSLTSKDQLVLEIQRANFNVKQSNHFDQYTFIPNITQYLLFFWNDITNSICINKENKKENEYEQFKKWFIKLTNADMTNGGLAISGTKHFLICHHEFKNDMDFDIMWNALEEEGCI